MVIGLPLINVPDWVCEGCFLRKQHMDSFLVGSSRIAKQPLELVYTNICDPMRQNLSHNKYILTFIDDFTRKNWIYLLEEKFKEFTILVDRQSSCNIKILRLTIKKFYKY